jgi:succinate dehydrogenase/fumarate reductase flavoprotein subunit
VAALTDGTYDVVVVDAEEGEDGTMTLDVAVSSGPRRGEVVGVMARRLDRGWADVLGAPATLTVTGGEPRLVFD